MRVSTSALVLGVASTALASTDQKPLGHTLDGVFGGFDKWAASMKEHFGEITAEAKGVWEEIHLLSPGVMDQVKQLHSPRKPKKTKKRPDDEWDFVTKGSELQGMWVENEQGESHRLVGGRLEHYNLRTKTVDPGSLNVDQVKQHSGYLDNEESDQHLFFWVFESRNKPETDPVVLWLNGGPGCSSLTGLFVELGPSKINAKLEVVSNPHSWNNNATVIFLDQPVGVGFSYGKTQVSDTFAASKDVYAFLTLFFQQFPQYSKLAFHIAGESYAGHYIPQMAAEILNHEHTNINLQSVLIGNGLTDPKTQYAYYRPMACGEGGYPAVLDESACSAMEAGIARCQSLIDKCYATENSWLCMAASIFCNNNQIGPYQRSGKNPYDVRLDCEPGTDGLCYKNINFASEWLNQQKVKDALGVEVVDSFDSCNYDINRKFSMAGDWMKPFYKVVPGLLSKIAVLVYAGDADFICNWLGNQAWVKKLEWEGSKKLNEAKVKDLRIDSAGKAYGNVQSAHNLTFMQIFSGGHMVPMDQPAASLDFFNRFIYGEWLDKTHKKKKGSK